MTFLPPKRVMTRAVIEGLLGLFAAAALAIVVSVAITVLVLR